MKKFCSHCDSAKKNSSHPSPNSIIVLLSLLLSNIKNSSHQHQNGLVIVSLFTKLCVIAEDYNPHLIWQILHVLKRNGWKLIVNCLPTYSNSYGEKVAIQNRSSFICVSKLLRPLPLETFLCPSERRREHESRKKWTAFFPTSSFTQRGNKHFQRNLWIINTLCLPGWEEKCVRRKDYNYLPTIWCWKYPLRV